MDFIAELVLGYADELLTGELEEAGIRDYKMVLDTEDDAAHVNWGGPWRMPTDEEFWELEKNCIFTWTNQGGHYGYMVTSKANENHIFLPASGCYSGTTFDWVSCFYWTSSLYSRSSIRAIYFQMAPWSIPFIPLRYHGVTVRPVCRP